MCNICCVKYNINFGKGTLYKTCWWNKSMEVKPPIPLKMDYVFKNVLLKKN